MHAFSNECSISTAQMTSLVYEMHEPRYSESKLKVQLSALHIIIRRGWACKRLIKSQHCITSLYKIFTWTRLLGCCEKLILPHPITAVISLNKIISLTQVSHYVDPFNCSHQISRARQPAELIACMMSDLKRNIFFNHGELALLSRDNSVYFTIMKMSHYALIKTIILWLVITPTLRKKSLQP